MKIRLILFTLCVGALSLHATTLSTSDLANMHRLFIQQREFSEVLKTLAQAKADNASDDIKKLAAADMAVLKAYLEKKNGSPLVREKMVNALRADLASLSRSTPNNAVYDVIAQELEESIGDTQTQHPLSSFVDTYSPGIASSVYYGLDGLADVSHRDSHADALSGTTPHQVWRDMQEKSSISALSALAGHGFGATQAAIPFVNKFGNDASRHSDISKGLAGAHLGARSLNLLYHWLTSSANNLTPQEAEALAYHNRRNGAPDYLKAEQERIKKLARFRVALRVLGQGVVPMALLGIKTPEGEEQYTSPSLATANATGLVDSLLGMYDRYRSSKAMQKLREELPDMIEALEQAPPQQQELAEDAEIAGIPVFDMASVMQEVM